jgi:hypothetical protein
MRVSSSFLSTARDQRSALLALHVHHPHAGPDSQKYFVERILWRTHSSIFTIKKSVLLRPLTFENKYTRPLLFK